MLLWWNWQTRQSQKLISKRCTGSIPVKSMQIKKREEIKKKSSNKIRRDIKIKKMVQLRSVRKVLDNTGVKEVRLIKVSNGSKVGYLGDQVVATVKKLELPCDFKKGEVVRGILVSSKVGRKRKSGIKLSFDVNGIVILNAKKEPVGTRVLGVVPRELGKVGQSKIIQLGSHVV